QPSARALPDALPILPLIAMLAMAYLAAMVMVGAQPVQRQFVKFEAKGVLPFEPESVRAISVGRIERNVTLVRSGENGWALEQGRSEEHTSELQSREK